MTVKSCKHMQACNAITRPEVLCSSWSQQFLSPRGATERLDQLQKLKTEVGTNWTENLGEDPTVENWCRKERWRDSNGFNMIYVIQLYSTQFPDQTRVEFDIPGPFQVRFRAFYGWCSLARCSSEAEQLEIPFLRGLEVLPYEEVPWGFVLRLPYVHQVPVMLRERLCFWRLSCCGAHTPAKKSWFSHFCLDKSAKEGCEQVHSMISTRCRRWNQSEAAWMEDCSRAMTDHKRGEQGFAAGANLTSSAPTNVGLSMFVLWLHLSPCVLPEAIGIVGMPLV